MSTAREMYEFYFTLKRFFEERSTNVSVMERRALESEIATLKLKAEFADAVLIRTRMLENAITEYLEVEHKSIERDGPYAVNSPIKKAIEKFEKLMGVETK